MSFTTLDSCFHDLAAARALTNGGFVFNLAVIAYEEERSQR